MTFTTQAPSQMRLYDHRSKRLYINAAERERFLAVAQTLPPVRRSLCLILAFSGCRISEALALQSDAIQVDAGLISFRTLKRRATFHIREVPVPQSLVVELSAIHRLAVRSEPRPLYLQSGKRLNRSTAYRWIKQAMLDADVSGAQACPKGLRHGFGIHAIRSGVPLNLVQKWMGHASMSTTAIYTNASGRDEQLIAARMWE